MRVASSGGILAEIGRWCEAVQVPFASPPSSEAKRRFEPTALAGSGGGRWFT